MEITGWITLAAVLVALGIGVSSIVQTNRLKTAEKRERLLNEIIEWALDLNKCGMGHKSTFSQAAVTDPVTPEKMFYSLSVLYDLASDIQGDASTLIVRSEHIKNICKKAFDKDLYAIIVKVIAALNEYNNSLLSELNAIPLDTNIKASDMNNVTALTKEVGAHKQAVKKLTNELLEKAANLMTANIE